MESAVLCKISPPNREQPCQPRAVAGALSAAGVGLTVGNIMYGVDALYAHFRVQSAAEESDKRLRLNASRCNRRQRLSRSLASPLGTVSWPRDIELPTFWRTWPPSRRHAAMLWGGSHVCTTQPTQRDHEANGPGLE